MACPICKSKKTDFSLKVKDYEYNINRRAVYNQCFNCKSLYRSKPKKISSKIYTSNYLPIKGNIFYDFLKNFNAIYEKNKIINILSKNFFSKNKIVLDVACGKGYLIKNFSKDINIKCVGIDNNIKNHKNNNLQFIKSSFDNYALIKKIKPDLIIINNFIEHVENLQKIKLIISNMKRKSRLIIITPNSNSKAKNYFLKFWSGFHSPRHKVIFNEYSISFFLNKNRKISYKKFKLFDPFSNLVSILNSLKDISFKNLFYDLMKLINLLFFVFSDVINKNRILVAIKKN